MEQKKGAGRTWLVQVVENLPQPLVNKTEIKRAVKRILNRLDCDHLPPHIREISILFCNDSEIHQLNLSYRQKDKPTDVLSFSMIEGVDTEAESPILGDIAISLDTASRQCRRYGNNFSQELLRLLVHGIHHLLGFDHEGVPRAAAQRMKRSEQRIFREQRDSALRLLRGSNASGNIH